MPVIQRVVKPKTRRGKLFLVNREPKVFENCKHTLFMKGRKCNDILRECVKDLYNLKKPFAQMMGKKNDIIPFENITPVEGFCRKHDASLFVFASSNKKRPNSLILGRLYSGQLLDMVELGVAKFKGMSQFVDTSIPLGIKPCLVFCGELWDQSTEMSRVRSMLVDIFRGEVIDAVRLKGLEHVMMFTATKDNILMRSYKASLHKSGTRLPRVEVASMGPSIDFVLRRTKLASEDLMKTACRKPQEARSRPVKNVSKDPLGTTHGRIHLGKQEIDNLQTRKMKGLKKTVAEKKQQKEAQTKRKAAATPEMSTSKKSRNEN